MRIALVLNIAKPLPAPGLPLEGYGGTQRVVVDLRNTLTNMGETVEVFRTGEPLFSVRDQIDMVRDLAEWRPDVVNSHDSWSMLHLGILGRVAPVLYSTHTPIWKEKVSYRPWFLRYILLEQAAARLCDVFVAESESIAEIVQRKVGPRHLEVAHLAVDTERYRTTKDGDPRTALGIGVITRRKAWHRAAVAAQAAGVHLRIAGPIVDREYAEELRRYGVELLGEVSNDRIFEELEACGMAVHPSMFESFGLAPVLAMSMSRPVVTGPEMAYLQGVRATPDVARMGDLMKLLAENNDLRRAEGLEARSVAEREYTYERMAHRYLSIYRGAVSFRDTSGSFRRGEANSRPRNRDSP